MPLGAEPGQGRWIGDAVFLGVLCVLAASCLALLLGFGYGRDQAIYALAGQAIVDGGAPYRDVWDFKPPAIYAFYAFARAAFGASPAAVRAVEALLLLSTFPAFAILSRRWVGAAAPGLAGAALAATAVAQLGFWQTAQPETFGGVLLAWALVLGTSEKRPIACWLAAGALFGVAGLCKPPLGAGVLVSAAFAGYARKGRSPLTRFGVPLVAFGLGAALPVAAAAAWLAAHDAFAPMWDAVFGFALRYTGLSLSVGGLPAITLRTLALWLLGLSPYLVIGLVPLLLLRPLGPRERTGLLHIGIVVAVLLLGVVVQAKLFPYHFAAALVLTALPAGWGLWKLWLRARLHPLGWIALTALLLVASAGWIPGLADTSEFWQRGALRVRALRQPAVRSGILDQLGSIHDVNASANRLAGEWIRAHSAEDARLFVWGFEPNLYLLADRRPSSRYIYNIPQRTAGAADGARADLLRDLSATPPEIIVVVRGDALPWVTGNDRDSEEELRHFPEFDALLRESYVQRAVFEDLRVLLRRQEHNG